MGVRCLVCKSDNLSKINEMLALGTKVEDVVAAYGHSPSAIRRHRTSCLTKPVQPTSGALPPLPVPPDLPDTVSELERARASMVWLEARVKWSSLAHEDGRVQALYNHQYLSAQKAYARLSGALEITEPQVVRTPAFRRVLDSLKEALLRHPDALRDLAEVVEKWEE